MASSSRGAAWGEDETKTLISIWGSVKVQEELDGKSRTKQVYNKIGQKMTEQGHKRDGEQCKTKIKNLNTHVKDHNNISGNNKKTCPFYDELDAVLGHRPASAPSLVLDASEGGLSVAVEPTERDESEDGMNEIMFFFINIILCSTLHAEESSMPKEGSFKVFKNNN